MLDRAENLLHDHYGGKEYWDVSAAVRVLGAEPEGAGATPALLGGLSCLGASGSRGQPGRG